MTNARILRVGHYVLWVVLAGLLGSVMSAWGLRWLHGVLAMPFITLAISFPLAWALRLIPGSDRQHLAVFLGAIVLALCTPVTTIALMIAACLVENQYGGHCVLL